MFILFFENIIIWNFTKQKNIFGLIFIILDHNHDNDNDNERLRGRFIDVHMYFTQALQRNDIRAVGMHLAMDLLRSKVRDHP